MVDSKIYSILTHSDSDNVDKNDIKEAIYECIKHFSIFRFYEYDPKFLDLSHLGNDFLINIRYSDNSEGLSLGHMDVIDDKENGYSLILRPNRQTVFNRNARITHYCILPEQMPDNMKE